MDEIVLEPRRRARRDLRSKVPTDPLGNSAAVETALPDGPRTDEGLTARELLERTRERLRRQVADHPESSAHWWTELPTGHWHVFAWERGKVLDDFVVENSPIGIKHGILKAALMRTLGRCRSRCATLRRGSGPSLRRRRRPWDDARNA